MRPVGQTLAVVLDLEAHPPGLEDEREGDPAGLGVVEGIGKRLLPNLKQERVSDGIQL